MPSKSNPIRARVIDVKSEGNNRTKIWFNVRENEVVDHSMIARIVGQKETFEIAWVDKQSKTCFAFLDHHRDVVNSWLDDPKSRRHVEILGKAP